MTTPTVDLHPTEKTPNDASTSPQEKFRGHCRDELIRLIDDFQDLAKWKKAFQIGAANQAIGESHQGRSLFEFLQNGRDAIRVGGEGGRLAVIVGDESTWIANTGAPFDLSDAKVEEQVRLIGSSQKQDDAIGEKGIGLRSVLMCAEKFEVHSRVGNGEDVHAVYSRAPTTRALCEAYLELGDDESSESPEWLSERGSQPLRRFDIDTSDFDFKVDEYLGDNEFFDRLPMVNLFMASPPPSNDARDDVTEALLNGGDLSETSLKLPNTDNLFGPDAQAFTTVIRLHHRDEEWRDLLENIQDYDGFETTENFKHHREKALLFEADYDSAGDSPPILAGECDDIAPETLVLFDNIDHALFWWRDEGNDWNYRHFDVRQKDNATEVQDDVERHEVAVKIDDSGAETELLRLYCLYTAPFGEGDDTDADESEESQRRLKCLVPNPGGDDEKQQQQQPVSRLVPQPLYLFYPIEDEPTPFRFALHGPFTVGADRQELLNSRSDENAEILNALRNLVGSAAEDLAVFDDLTVFEGLASSEGCDFSEWRGFADYMPWLVMPDDTQLDGCSSDYAEQMRSFYEVLEDRNIAPVDDGSPVPPSQILYDPQRPDAFEVMRGRATFDAVDFELMAKSSVTTARELDEKHVPSPENCLGLTHVLDTPVADGDGWVELLSEIWPDYRADSDQQQHRMAYQCSGELEDPGAYFKAIAAAMRAAQLDAKKTQEVAETLGTQKTPLIPAHIEGNNQYLVRAVNRQAPQERGKPAERIVFRSDGSAGNAPKPETDLSVYFTRHDGTDWYPPDTRDAKSFGRIWGMTDFGGAAYYRRIASELGKRDEGHDNLSFLRDAYWRAIDAADRPASWLEPAPLRVETAEDIDQQLKGSWGSKPEDGFRARKWIPNIHLPSATDDSNPAHALCFGTDWAKVFGELAEMLDEFEELVGMLDENEESKLKKVLKNLAKYSSIDTDDSGDEEYKQEVRQQLAARLHRWKKLIETTARVSDFSDYDAQLAAPKHFDLSNDDNSPKEMLEVVFHLVHLGVGIGPRVNIWWFAPKCDDLPRALSDENARDLSVNQQPNIFSECFPEASNDFLDNYQDLIWSSEYHPTITANHSDGCSLHRKKTSDALADEKRGKWLKSKRFRQPDVKVAIAEWIDIPLLRSHLNPDASDPDTTKMLRQVVRLAWPDWQRRIMNTAWLCADNGHHIKTKRKSVPTTAWFLIHQLPIWKNETGAESDDTASKPRAAAELIAPQDEDEQLRGARQYLPRIVDTDCEDEISPPDDSDSDSEDKKWPPDDPELPAFRRFARDIGATAIDKLTPFEAVTRLQSFVDEHFDDTRELTEAIRTPWYALVRRLISTDHLTADFEERIARHWVARDLWALDWPLLAVEGDTLCRLDDGETADLYKERLDEQKRRYRGDDANPLVFRPAEIARPMFETLALFNEDEDADISFSSGSISLEDSAPEPTRPSIDNHQCDERKELQNEVNDRIDYLVAAVYKTRRSGSKQVPGDVRDKLLEWVNHGKVIRQDLSKKGINSAIAKGHDDIIVVSKRTLDDLPDETRHVVLAEGLAQLLEKEIDIAASKRLIDHFRTALGTDTQTLDYNWKKELGKTANHDKRVQNIQERLKALVTALNGKSENLEEPPAEDQSRQVLNQVGNLNELDDSELQSPLSDWLETLKSALVENDVNLGEQDIDTVARQLVQFARWRSSLRLSADPEVCDILRRLDAEFELDDHWGKPSESWSSEEREIKNIARRLVELSSLRHHLSELHEDDPDASPEELQKAIIQALSGANPRPPTGHDDILDEMNLDDEGVEHFYELRTKVSADDLVEKLKTWLENLFQSPNSETEWPGQELFKAVRDKLESDETSLEELDLEGLFDVEPSTTSKTNRQKRREFTERFTERVSDIDVKVDATSTSKEPGSLKERSGRSGSGGGSTSVGNETQEFGKLAELIVVKLGFERFQKLDSEQRSAVVEAVCCWRNDDEFNPWDLHETDADFSALTTTDDVADESFEIYRQLVDVSEHKHPWPGFDVIDPFGNPDAELPDSFDDYPRDATDYLDELLVRVEVKGVRGALSENVNVKLTSNEYKMARTVPGKGSPGDDSGPKLDDEFYRYVIRVVAIDVEDDADLGNLGNIEVLEIRDIPNVNPADDEVELLRRLRSGHFWVRNQGIDD